jgi:hypothetical protein
VAGDWWKLRTLLLVLVLSLLRLWPDYSALQQPGVGESWHVVQTQSQHPLMDMALLYPGCSHEAKLTFRLTVPLVVRIAHLGQTGILVLFALCGAISLYQVLANSYRLTGSRVTALWLSVAVGCTWPGVLGFHQLLGGFYDAVAICLLLLAMSADAPIIAGLCIFVASWTDERALLGSGMVFLFAVIRSERRGIREILAGKPLAVLLASAAYAATRLCCTAVYSLRTATDCTGSAVFRSHLSAAPLSVWSGLGACWWVVICCIGVLLRQRRYAMTLALLLGLGVVVLPALCVEDMTRSMAYTLPSLLVAAAIIGKSQSNETTERMAITCALVSTLIPTLYMQQTSVTWFLPFHVVRWSWAPG